MAVSRSCPTCGSPLVNGACMTCPVQMYAPQPRMPSGPVATPVPPVPGGIPQLGGQAGYNAPQAPGARYAGMWNWGAFLLCPLWLMNHGRVGRGILYIVLSLIPFVGLITLGMAIAYGIKGNVVAATSRHFNDDAQFVAVQNAWRNWGFGMLIVSVAIGVIGAFAQTASGRG
jgi:hypothetical protein